MALRRGRFGRGRKPSWVSETEAFIESIKTVQFSSRAEASEG